MVYGENAQLAWDTILRKSDKRVPSWLFHTMQHDQLEYFANAEKGEYVKNPEKVYMDFQKNVGTCLLDQYIPTNPLTMSDKGYESDTQHGATTGAEEIVLDGILIDSPEAVVEHLETIVFPKIIKDTAEFIPEAFAACAIEAEKSIQSILGDNILKSGYGYIGFPSLSYFTYGYENYFCAYALYPEVMEKHFKLQAEFCRKLNIGAVKVYKDGNLAPLYRLDHDMADGRGTLVDIKSLDKIWFPYFAYALEPILKTDMNLIWHCDGNLSQMVPRLIDVGIRGFQGFQYEQGMDYQKICQMRTKDNESLIIIAGVSVTRELPFGTPADVKAQIDFLVENGPKTGLFLGCSSSITPGVPLENIKTMVEGFKYYRYHGR